VRGFWIPTAALLAVRLALAVTAPLGDDEGYYWVWSRHPAAGYYDHPPLVAWLVAGSVRALGDTLFAMRLPFVLLGTLAAVLLRSLVTAVTGDRGLADRSALLLQVVPVFFGLGLLVIPDTPLLVAWLLFALAAWRALGAARPAPFPAGALAIGAALGLGLLAKYVAVLLPLSLAGWLLRARGASGAPVLLAALGVAAIVFAPVVAWNAAHEWASLGFQFASRHRGSAPDAGRLALFLGSQALYLSPVLFALAVPAALRAGPWRWRVPDAGLSFLWWMAVPTVATFLVASLFTSFKPNWPAPACATLLPLLLAGLDRWKGAGSRWAAPLERSAIAVAVGAVALAATHLVHPFAPLPEGTDPTADGRGWTQAAAAAGRAAASLGGERRVVFAAGRYPNASRLEFHLPGRPPVACLNPGRDAYDDWQNLDSLRGADVVFVATSRFPSPPDALLPGHECREFERVEARAGPRAAHRITVYACRWIGGRPAARAR